MALMGDEWFGEGLMAFLRKIDSKTRDGPLTTWKPWRTFRQATFYNAWREHAGLPIPLLMLTFQVGTFPYRGVWFNAAVLGYGFRAEWMRHYERP